jgi:hypothetical protein
MIRYRIGDEFAPDRSALWLHTVKRKQRFRFAARDVTLTIPITPFLEELRGGNRLGQTRLQRPRKRTHVFSAVPELLGRLCARYGYQQANAGSFHQIANLNCRLCF